MRSRLGITILLIISLTLTLSHGAMAYKISSISIEPDSTLTEDAPVTISFQVFNLGDCPPCNNLKFSTGLENPVWDYTIVQEGKESYKKRIYNDTTVISYLPRNQVSFPIFMSLSGTAPHVIGMKKITLLGIMEMNNTNGQIASTITERTVQVFNISHVYKIIPSARANLSAFRSHIDEKAAMGVNTTGAEAKYRDAKDHIDFASCLDTNSYEEDLHHISVAENLIVEGEHLLDKAWAEKILSDAQERIDRTDEIIGWCRGNGTTRSLSQLYPIFSGREIAVSYVSMAEDEIYEGNYSAAPAIAQRAYDKANETYSEADTLYRILDQPPPCIECRVYSLLFQIISAGFVVIILSIAGIFWWKKKKNRKAV